MNRKVAIYARVSTEHEAQLSALDNQVQYYDDILDKHPNWILYDRYIDEGITGTSIKKRKNFIRMMKDAHEGKFDLICEYIKLRNESNISQSELSKRVGIARSTTARLERNLHSISLGTFIKLLEAMNYKLEIVRKEDANESR